MIDGFTGRAADGWQSCKFLTIDGADGAIHLAADGGQW